jgi:CBS domain containing-hemolysin-like protein
MQYIPTEKIVIGAPISAGADPENASIGLLIVYLLIALGFSFLCSIAEAVLLSITPSFVTSLKKTRPRTSARLHQMKQNVDRPLAAILSLNTIAHTVGAAGVGAQAVAVYGEAYVGVISAVLTLLILVLSEIIPKTVGAVYWRLLAGPVSQLVAILIWILFPFVWMSEQLTQLLTPKGMSKNITREEFAALATLGAEQGHLDRGESRIMKNLLRFGSLRVEDIMTPRTVVITLSEGLTVDDALEAQPDLRVSRIPIYAETPDQMTGFVLKTDILLRKARGEGSTHLSDLRRPLRAVDEAAPLPDLFEMLLGQREHIAVVVDEYGGLAGLVTLEDLIETLLGLEIVDEVDETVDLQQLARKRWQERATRLGLTDVPSSPPSEDASL